jgi:ubiquinone/menaquinone biosynthesis C-methylase UbiE
MSTEEPHERENSYVFNAHSAAEMHRLTIQGQMLTQQMGSFFPEHLDLSTLHNVLDIACGPGEWAIDVAYAHHDMHVVGIDISETMIRYATARTWPNALFRVMDVTQPLDFPDATFDFINARLMLAFLRPSAWPQLLSECLRLTRSGGYMRLTEAEKPITNGPAFEQLHALMARALYHSGQSFSPNGREFGITPMLGGLLRDAGYQNIRHSAFAIDFSSHGNAHEYMVQNYQIGFLLAQPFLLKWSDTTQEELTQLIQQAGEEMVSESFRATSFFLNVWGNRPAIAEEMQNEQK